MKRKKQEIQPPARLLHTNSLSFHFTWANPLFLSRIYSYPTQPPHHQLPKVQVNLSETQKFPASEQPPPLTGYKEIRVSIFK